MMKAAKFYNAKDIRIENVEEVNVKPGYVKVEVEWCGICGSDLHEYVAGPINIMGNRVMGHEYAGRIVEVGEEVENVQVGDRVAGENMLTCGKCEYCQQGRRNLCVDFGIQGFTADGAFAKNILVRKENVHKLPENLSFEHAALVEPASVAHHAVKSSTLKTGDTCVVFGAGPIGLFVTAIAKVKGAKQVIVVEMSEHRRKKALELGATHVINPIEEDSVKKIKELTNGIGADVAFEAAGVQPTFVAGIDSLRKTGELMIVAIYEKEVSFQPNWFVITEKKISTSFCYTDDFPKVINLFSSGKINPELLITKKINLNDILDEGFETLINDKSQCKILVTPKVENLQ